MEQPDPSPREGAIETNHPLNEEEMSRVFLERWNGLVRYAQGRGAPEPEDTVQNAYESFLKRLRKPDAPQLNSHDFINYIIRCIHLKIIDEYRHRTNTHALDVTPLGSYSLDHAAPPVDLESDIELRELVAAMRRVVSPVQLESILLTTVDGYTGKEVGVLLGIPEGTVKSHKRIGLAALRAAAEPRAKSAENT